VELSVQTEIDQLACISFRMRRELRRIAGRVRLGLAPNFAKEITAITHLG